LFHVEHGSAGKLEAGSWELEAGSWKREAVGKLTLTPPSLNAMLIELQTKRLPTRFWHKT